jgi:cell division protein YceG involved in septum cleavage
MKELKNQLIATVGIIITAAGGLFIANMEAIFSPAEPVAIEQSITVPEGSKDTIVITKTIKPAIVKPPVKKTEKEKRKAEGLDW